MRHTKLEGWDVIVLDKDRHRRADGKLKCLEPVESNFACSRGKTRYDVHLDDQLTEVDPDKPLPPHSVTPKRCKEGTLYLNRSGVAILR